MKLVASDSAESRAKDSKMTFKGDKITSFEKKSNASGCGGGTPSVTLTCYALALAYGKLAPGLGDRSICAFAIFDQRDYSISALNRLVVFIENIALFAPVVETFQP
jgi:hypothetical protein